MSQTIYDTTHNSYAPGLQRGYMGCQIILSGNGIGKLGQQTVHQGFALPPL